MNATSVPTTPQDSSMTHAYIQRPPVATPPTQWTVWELLPCLRRQKVNKPPKPTLGGYNAGLYDPPASTPYAAEPLRNASLRGRRPTKVGPLERTRAYRNLEERDRDLPSKKLTRMPAYADIREVPHRVKLLYGAYSKPYGL